MALVKCPCAFRLRRLAQNAGHGGVLGHFPCKFLHEMALVRSPVQPSRRFGPVRSLSLWKEILCRDLDTEVSSRELAQRSCTESSYRDLVQRSLQESCQETSYRVVHRSCQATASGDPVQTHCVEISCRDLAKRSLT